MRMGYLLAGGATLLLLGILTGCSLFFSNDVTDPALQSTDESSMWLIAAQGQASPPQCVSALSRGQAKRLAEKILNAKQEAKLLKQALEKRGKKLVLSRAHGCKVKNKPKGQGLSAMQTSGDEATLIEVPAGNDAALYLLENTEDGNEWASLKEVSDIGETLVHLEVGLLEETAVAGLQTEGTVGQMSLVLPDDVGTQELASDLQQLFSSQETTTAQEGVSALQAEGLDWAHAEVIVDQGSVVSYSDGTQELEAVVVIPELGSTGQVLWGRTNPMLDVSRATFAKVTVKKTPSQGSTRPTLQVTTPPAQLKHGSELQFEPFDLCPYQHYGRVSPFTRPLCYQWEQKAAPKVQQVTFDRGIKSLPTVHTQALQSTGNTTGGIMGMAGPKGNLLLVGMKQVDPQTIQKIYEQAMNETTTGSLGISSSDDEEEVEGQQLYEIIRFILETMKELWDLWQRMSAEERQRVVDALQFIWSDPLTECRNYYNASIPSDQSRAYTNFINNIAQALVNHGLQSDINLARNEALNSVCNFINSIKTRYQDSALMQGIMQQFGAVGIFIYAKLEEAQRFSNSRYTFPSDLKKLFEDAFALRGKVGNFESLLQYLAAAAYQAVLHQGSGTEGEQGLEGIARSQLLMGLFSQLAAKGWPTLFAFWKPPFSDPAMPTFDFWAFKPGDPLLITGTLVAGFLEPYLTSGEVTDLINRLINASQQLGQFLDILAKTLRRNIVVQVIDKVDSQMTLDTLCQQISGRYHPIPIVVIVDGAVACHSSNISSQDAVQQCFDMGFTRCSSYPSPPIPGPGPGPSPTTLVVPQPSSPPSYCTSYKICII
jgi:hypothetical protein